MRGTVLVFDFQTPEPSPPKKRSEWGSERFFKRLMGFCFIDMMDMLLVDHHEHYG